MRLILASASPRRSDLLRAAGFVFETLPVDVDEYVRDAEEPEACVRRLAQAKSAAGAARISDPDAVVLGADTVVTVDGAILGKPHDDDESARMLERLSGRSHEVATGVSVRCRGQEAGCVELSTVFFARMSTAEIAWYVQSGEGRDKAGAYAIQGIGSRFVERIAGSYSNVVGLPISAVYRLLRQMGERRSEELR